MMKTLKFKPFLLALILPILSGCAFINNIVSNAALNVVFASDYLLNKITFTGGEEGVVALNPKPTSEANAANLTYGVEALVIPEQLELQQMGLTVALTFEVEFTVTGTESLFYTEAFDLGSGDGIEASANIYYPIGTETPPESVEDIGDWLNIDRIQSLKNQEEKEVVIKITGKTAANNTKTQSFYFNLNSESILIPGDGADIDEDYALAITDASTRTSREFTLDKTELAAPAGVTLPLQVFWIDFTGNSSGDGEVEIDVVLDSTVYEVVLPTSGSMTLTVNETLLDYPITIKLKTGQPAPSADYVVEIGAILTLPSTTE